LEFPLFPRLSLGSACFFLPEARAGYCGEENARSVGDVGACARDIRHSCRASGNRRVSLKSAGKRQILGSLCAVPSARINCWHRVGNIPANYGDQHRYLLCSADSTKRGISSASGAILATAGIGVVNVLVTILVHVADRS